MVNAFKRILIPVDFSANTEIAIKKGIELAVAGTVIHLLHVHRKMLKKPMTGRRGYDINGILPPDQKTKQKLEKWKSDIEESGVGVSVYYWVVNGFFVQRTIMGIAKAIGADLVVIGKQSYHSWFPFLNTVVPGRIAGETGIAVLTVKPGAYLKTKTMIVSVSGGSMNTRREIIAAICSKFKLKIHLVTFGNSGNASSDFDASGLLSLYQWLKTSTHCQVEYSILYGRNKARSILRYARRINADMLLVHPETGTKIAKLDKQAADMLSPASGLQVLTVQ